MYEAYKLCPSLKQKEVCIVLEQYRDGLFERCFHHHVPTSRFSANSQTELLRSLICRYNGVSGLGFEQIVHSYVNARGKEPPKFDPFQIHTSFPEPGVLRTYCGTDTKAWADRIIGPSEFRKH